MYPPHKLFCIIGFYSRHMLTFSSSPFLFAGSEFEYHYNFNNKENAKVKIIVQECYNFPSSIFYNSQFILIRNLFYLCLEDARLQQFSLAG